MPPSALHRLLSIALSLAAGWLATGLLLAVLARPVPALAAPAAQTYDFPGACGATLQACLNAASPGDTIRVLAGTYTGSLTLSKAVSLTGVSSATTILRAATFQRVLTITGAAVNSSVVISGLTFSGGQLLAGCPADCRGAGVLVTGTAQPLFVNVTISGNVSLGFGGGLYAYAGSPLVMTNSVVRGNLGSLSGGGAYAVSAASLTGGRFEANQCTQPDCNGGGLWAGALVLTNTQFINNAASRGGGAYSESNATLNGGMFQENQSTTASGGGLLTLSVLTLNGTQFISNSTGNNGGGAWAGSASLTGGLFQGNNANGSGGGLYVANEVVLIGTTFLSNTTAYFGGGVLADSASLTGGLFQGNTAESGGGGMRAGSVTISASRFMSNTADGENFDGGGGVRSSGHTSITDSLFQGNVCDCMGGGLRATGYATIHGVQFVANTAERGGGTTFTGAHGDTYLVNNLFANNQATSNEGAAILVRDLFDDSHSVLLHNTFANTQLGSGSAIYVEGGNVTAMNNLITLASIGLENDAGTVGENANLFDNVLLPYVGGVTSGGSSLLNGQAAFVDAPGGDFRLTEASDAIDAGFNAGVSVDAFGAPRPLGAGFDIGFHEFGLGLRVFLPLSLR